MYNTLKEVMYMVSFHSMEFNKKEPVYLQLKNHIKKKILAKQIHHYEELPSRRELALTLSINPNTVQKAFKQLEDEGLIKTISNVKSVVIVNDEIINEIKEDLLATTINVFINECKGSGLDFQQTIALLAKNWEK